MMLSLALVQGCMGIVGLGSLTILKGLNDPSGLRVGQETFLGIPFRDAMRSHGSVCTYVYIYVYIYMYIYIYAFPM